MAYSHPRAQAFLLGCVLFLTVGTYNVITFLGGAGQQTAYLSDGEHLPNLVCYAFDGSSKLYISMGFEFPWLWHPYCLRKFVVVFQPYR
jgi:hypothetical protein